MGCGCQAITAFPSHRYAHLPLRTRKMNTPPANVTSPIFPLFSGACVELSEVAHEKGPFAEPDIEDQTDIAFVIIAEAAPGICEIPVLS